MYFCQKISDSTDISITTNLPSSVYNILKRLNIIMQETAGKGHGEQGNCNCRDIKHLIL